MTTLFPKNSNDACRMFLTSSVATRRGKNLEPWNAEKPHYGWTSQEIVMGVVEVASWFSRNVVQNRRCPGLTRRLGFGQDMVARVERQMIVDGGISSV